MRPCSARSIRLLGQLLGRPADGGKQVRLRFPQPLRDPSLLANPSPGSSPPVLGSGACPSYSFVSLRCPHRYTRINDSAVQAFPFLLDDFADIDLLAGSW